MNFEFSERPPAATDKEAGFRITQDMKFYDETTVRLKFEDLLTGQSWTFPIGTIDGPVTYSTPKGPNTSTLTLSATLPRRLIETIVAEVIAARRGHGRPLEIPDLFKAIEDGAFKLMTYGGYQLKFVPDFRLSWQ